MSKPGDFDRLDGTAGRKPAPRDRFEDFKATTSRLIEYRNAYHAAQQRGVSLAGLPHPDAVGRDEVEEALRRLESLATPGPQRLEGVPPVDLRAEPGPGGPSGP